MTVEKPEMSEALRLKATLNAPCIPVTEEPRLVYLLIEVGGGLGDSVLAVNLVLVVDASDSMHIRLATEAQFQKLARAGVLKEVLIDGVPAWTPEGVPEEALLPLPRKIDRVKEALGAVVEHLRPADRFALVCFAREALTIVPNTPGSRKDRLFEAIGDPS